MDYNMYFADLPTDGEVVALLATQDAISKAVNPAGLPEGSERDAAAKAWDAAWEAYGSARVRSFRLSERKLTQCREIMDRLRMLTAQEHPQWPGSEAFGLPRWQTLIATDADSLTEALERFALAQEAVTDAEPQPVTGIPSHKLDSKSGWLVTPAQIGAALTAWEASDEQERRAAVGEHHWFSEWIAWLGKAQGRGGFRVY
ncbi:hypothetical protein ACGF12_30400 [Kitasatospora sp. NPDC048296]|uniref:hypothetical protein n=1 Tax=Kitasatospora sp. NPDC048296 TaxID=3364048 RepID=UPI003716BEBC